METLDKLTTVSPQIQTNELEKLAESDIKHIICHRPDEEENEQPSFEVIEKEAEKVDIKAYHLPVRDGEFPEQAIAKTAEILARAAEQQEKVHMYCRSGTRSTIIWAAIEAQKGTDLESIIDTAANAGYGIGQLRDFLAQYQS
ncbi:TIGR01244 family sulfur transferase [Suttonella ornithocola]|uniref:Uncharacterized protein conserved in bacteria n=1 Tax=Suttonella ornithocola TaxID=279832 RepID=A0A380MX26_9GAMM|nr:TIGR01244 family sulfur transferase [Suttonella ornithocola]SUO96453.1 Uncharacterized protein conserved in bacteria [Suttonella ornithocola]